MAEQQTFSELLTSYQEKLDLFTTAITRAHGESHPEAFKVRELYEAISAKVNNGGSDKPDLDAEFAELRKVTNHYAIPGDVCQTFAATYDMLAEVDKAYHA